MRTEIPIYLGGEIGGTLTGYAIFEDDVLLGFISEYDYRDGNFNRELGSLELLLGNVGNWLGAKSLLRDARATAINSPTNSLLERTAQEIDQLYIGELTNLLNDISFTLQVGAIEAIVGAFVPSYLSAVKSTLEGGSIPTILATASGNVVLETLATTADFSPERNDIFYEVRDLSTEEKFTVADYSSAPDNTLFVTYDTSGSDEAIGWSVSPNLNTDVFSDATGASNDLLSATAVDATIDIGAHIDVTTLFPDDLWVDQDGSQDITAFAIQDRTPGGGYLEFNGVRVPEQTVFELPISELSKWKFVAANAAATDEIGFNIIQSNGDFSPRLIPGATVSTSSESGLGADAVADAILAGTFLARAVYGGGSIHPGFRGAFQGDDDPQNYDDNYRGYLASQSTADQTWTILDETDLGSATLNAPDEARFTAGGLYVATNNFDIFGNGAEVLAAETVLNGEKTVVLSFRGSDGSKRCVRLMGAPCV